LPFGIKLDPLISKFRTVFLWPELRAEPVMQRSRSTA
jgi:hypothetical protein